MLRLGGPVYAGTDDLEAWAQANHAAGYSAVYVPFGYDAPDAKIEAFREICQREDLLIAEVGAWSNTISPDAETRKKAIAHCVRSLEFADHVGARCCVNISGGRGEQWDGPHPDNLTEATFALTVETVQTIIDTAKPQNAFYTLETMPWVFPHSADSYLRLIQAIDRPQFAVHFDPVNLINSPERYFFNADFLRECFAKLGSAIQSCHAKDITLSGRLTVHLDEARPGQGALDYGVFLSEADKLGTEMPILLEHLPSAEEYVLAAQYVREAAQKAGVTLR